MERLSLERFQNPLPLDQSILVAVSDVAGGADAGVLRPVLRRLHAPRNPVGVGQRRTRETIAMDTATVHLLGERFAASGTTLRTNAFAS